MSSNFHFREPSGLDIYREAVREYKRPVYDRCEQELWVNTWQRKVDCTHDHAYESDTLHKIGEVLSNAIEIFATFDCTRPLRTVLNKQKVDYDVEHSNSQHTNETCADG